MHNKRIIYLSNISRVFILVPWDFLQNSINRSAHNRSKQTLSEENMENDKTPASIPEFQELPYESVVIVRTETLKGD